jgi:hypothetical protein
VDRPRTDSEFRAERLGSALRGLAAELVDERRKVVELRREIAKLRLQLASIKPTQNGDEIASGPGGAGAVTTRRSATRIGD